MIIFNIEGNIECEYYPIKKNKNHKSLIGIAYNNHFYPLKNKELHRIPKKEAKNIIYDNNLNDVCKR